MKLVNIAEKISSRYVNILIVGFFIATSIFVLAPFLVQENFMVSTDSDALYYYYPAFEFYGNALKSGESFLWNPFLFSGFPMYLSQSGGFLDPLNIVIFKFLPTILGYHFRLLIDFVLVMVFSYLAARSFGISRLASSLVGMGYLLAFHWRFLTNILIANSLFLLPFLFFVFNKSLEGKRRSWLWAVFGGVGVGWTFIGGYAQFIVYAVFLLGLYGLGHILWIEGDRKDISKWMTLVGFFVILITVSFVVGSPQIIPSMEFTPLTQRAGGLDYSLTTYKVVEPGDAILFLFPDYLYFPYVSSGRKSLYVGPLLFFMAIVGLVIAIINRADKKYDIKNIWRILTLGLLLGFTLLASLKWSPVFYLMNKLPVFEYFRFPYRWMYLGVWFIALLGAWGFDQINGLANDHRLKKLFGLLTGGVSVLVAIILSLNFFTISFWQSIASAVHLIFSKIVYGNFGFNKDPAHYFEAIQRGIAAWQDFVYLGNLNFLFPFLMLVFALTLCVVFLWGYIGWKRFRVIGFLLSFSTFLGVFMVQWPSSISRDLVVDPQVSFFGGVAKKEDQVYYRLFPFMLNAGFTRMVPPKFTLTHEENLALTELQFESGLPDMNFYSNIQSVDGYDPFVSRDILYALNTIGSTYGGGEVENLTPEERISRLLNRLDVLGMMSGKYIISGVELMHSDLKLLVSKEVSRYKIPVFIYENKRAIPKFYFAKNTVLKPGKSLEELIKGQQADFSNFTYLDCVDCLIGKSVGQAKIKELTYKNGFIKISTESDEDKWLIISESYLPGWSATIDKKSVTIVRANGLYMALYIPKGVHEIIVHYDGILGERNILQYLNIIR